MAEYRARKRKETVKKMSSREERVKTKLKEKEEALKKEAKVINTQR